MHPIKRAGLLLLLAVSATSTYFESAPQFAYAASATPTAADVVLGTPIVTTFGQTLKFQSFTYDLANQNAIAVWQTFDGAALSGKFFTVSVRVNGTTYTFTNGTTAFDPSVTFSSAGVQGVINLTTLQAFGAAHAQ